MTGSRSRGMPSADLDFSELATTGLPRIADDGTVRASRRLGFHRSLARIKNSAIPTLFTINRDHYLTRSNIAPSIQHTQVFS